MTFSIKVNGLTEAIKRMDFLQRQGVPQALELAMSESTRLVLGKLQQNTPVDTGALRDSEDITRVSPLKAFVGPDSTKVPHYAPDVEFGHHTRSGSFVPGQHFIQRTALETQQQVVRIFADRLRGLIN